MSVTTTTAEQVEEANSSDRTPVVFIHGLWLLPSSWDRWATVFEEAGFIALTPGWPDDPETVRAVPLRLRQRRQRGGGQEPL
jgi:non-heme chloroperoxidase